MAQGHPIRCSSGFTRPQHSPWRVFRSAEECNVLLPLVPRHLLALLRLRLHHPHTLIGFLLFLGHALKGGMGSEMIHHPLMQGLDVGDGVDDAPRAQRKGVLGIQRRRHNSRLVFPRLEVRVGEANEDLGELRLLEEIWEELHAVCAETADVLVQAGFLVLDSERLDTLLDILCYRCPNLKAYQSQQAYQ